MNIATSGHEWIDMPLLEVKFASEESAKGTFTGYASVFGNTDLGGDVVEPGAFQKTLAKRGAPDVLMLWGHKATEIPIGKWISLEEDGRGLKAVGQLELGLAKAREVYTAMSAGLVKGLSIGFVMSRDDMEWDDRKKVRRLKTITELLEVSVVNIPMNQRAILNNVKAANHIKTIREFESFLRDEGGFSNAAARAIAEGGFKAAPEPRDEDELAQLAARLSAVAARVKTST